MGKELDRIELSDDGGGDDRTLIRWLDMPNSGNVY
jgi:hypothetical protein